MNNQVPSGPETVPPENTPSSTNKSTEEPKNPLKKKRQRILIIATIVVIVIGVVLTSIIPSAEELKKTDDHWLKWLIWGGLAIVFVTSLLTIFGTPNWSVTGENERKGRWVIPALVVMIVALAICWLVSVKQQKTEVAALKQAVMAAEQTKLAKEYVASWKARPGDPVYGRQCLPMRAEKVIDNGGTELGFDVYYEEYHTPVVSHNRLSRANTNELWNGTWEQPTPPDGGQLVLEQKGSDYWTGTMTAKNGSIVLYTIELKKGG